MEKIRKNMPISQLYDKMLDIENIEDIEKRKCAWNKFLISVWNIGTFSESESNKHELRNLRHIVGHLALRLALGGTNDVGDKAMFMKIFERLFPAVKAVTSTGGEEEENIDLSGYDVEKMKKVISDHVVEMEGGKLPVAQHESG